MSLITCPECKKRISHKAIQCTSCGWPVPEQIRNASDEFVDDVQKMNSLESLVPTWGVDKGDPTLKELKKSISRQKKISRKSGKLTTQRIRRVKVKRKK